MRCRGAEAWLRLCAPQTSSVTSDGNSASPPRLTLYSVYVPGSYNNKTSGKVLENR